MKILQAILANPSVSISELSQILGLSVAGVEKNIRVLKLEERVRRIGPDKGGHWEVL